MQFIWAAHPLWLDQKTKYVTNMKFIGQTEQMAQKNQYQVYSCDATFNYGDLLTGPGIKLIFKVCNKPNHTEVSRKMTYIKREPQMLKLV